MGASLPEDDKGRVAQLVPDTAVLKYTLDSTISANTQITLQAGTKFIEISALGGGVHVLMGAGTASAATDGASAFIHEGGTRNYKRGAGIDEINIIEQDAGATVIVIEQ